MDPAHVEQFLTRQCERVSGQLVNKKTGRRVSAILPVHILGHPVDMDPLLRIAKQYDLRVIEDATEGLGASYKGRPVGALGDIGCFSFNGNKLITTGGGGMLVTNREDWAERAKYLTTQAKDDPIEYVHGEIGFNYRLTNVLAAIGCAQIEQLSEYIQKKQAIARHYNDSLSGLPGIRPMPEAPWATSTFWMYTVLVDDTEAGLTSRELMRALGGKKIQTRPLWQPIHRSPAHIAASAASCPVAETLSEHALSLPCSVGLTQSEQARVIQQVRNAVLGRVSHAVPI
jgi:perosamine synthetase